MTGAVRTTCPYCGVGCGVLAKPDGSPVAGDPSHPASGGRLCGIDSDGNFFQASEGSAEAEVPVTAAPIWKCTFWILPAICMAGVSRWLSTTSCVMSSVSPRWRP